MAKPYKTKKWISSFPISQKRRREEPRVFLALEIFPFLTSAGGRERERKGEKGRERGRKGEKKREKWERFNEK